MKSVGPNVDGNSFGGILPTGSMGLVYLPTFHIKNHSNAVYVPYMDGMGCGNQQNPSRFDKDKFEPREK